MKVKKRSLWTDRYKPSEKGGMFDIAYIHTLTLNKPPLASCTKGYRTYNLKTIENTIAAVYFYFHIFEPHERRIGYD